jgi:hypothetical protein
MRKKSHVRLSHVRFFHVRHAILQPCLGMSQCTDQRAARNDALVGRVGRLAHWKPHRRCRSCMHRKSHDCSKFGLLSNVHQFAIRRAFLPSSSIELLCFIMCCSTEYVGPLLASISSKAFSVSSVHLLTQESLSCPCTTRYRIWIRIRKSDTVPQRAHRKKEKQKKTSTR